MRRALVVAVLACAGFCGTAWSIEATSSKTDEPAKAETADPRQALRESLSPEVRDQLDEHDRY